MILKYIFISLIIISAARLSYGQLKVNAGDNFTLCKGIKGIDTTIIGGNPTAIGGSEPYKYCWITYYSKGLQIYNASAFIDDTTLANPKLINAPDDSIKFKVRVTDRNGLQKEDSLKIRFSTFYYSSQDKFATVYMDEDNRLWTGITGGIPPLTYSWSPDDFIYDASIAHPIVSSDHDVDFTVIAIDSFGCVSEPDTFRLNVETY